MSDKVFEVNFNQGDQRGGLLVGSSEEGAPVNITTANTDATKRTSYSQEIIIMYPFLGLSQKMMTKIRKVF